MDAVRALLAAGANKDATDRKRWTALHHAASQKHVDVINVLAAAGAELESKDRKGLTALRHASEEGNIFCG
jgi:ankyrin repeat protein